VVGSLLITLLRHCDRVTSACLAQLVNTLSPIRTEPDGLAWRQTTFYPFALTARHAKGDVLRVEPQTPTYETAAYGEVPVIDATATHDPESGDMTILAVNRHQSEPVRVQVRTAAFGNVALQEACPLTDDDPLAVNSEGDPHRVVPTPIQAVVEQDAVLVELPPVSWTCLRLATG